MGHFIIARTGQSEQPHMSVFIPSGDYENRDKILELCDTLVDADTCVLNSFVQQITFGGELAYASLPYPSGDLKSLVNVLGGLPFLRFQPLFYQIAHAVDEAIALDLPGVELSSDEVKVSLGSEADTLSGEAWEDLVASRFKTAGGEVESIQVYVRPRLEEGANNADLGATMGGDDMGGSPLAHLAALVYGSVSGMVVRQAAFLSPAAYVASSNFSEDSNRYLSEVISGSREPDSGVDFIQRLFELEGTAFDSNLLNANISLRSAKMENFSTIRSHFTNMSAAGAPFAELKKVSNTTVWQPKQREMTKDPVKTDQVVEKKGEEKFGAAKREASPRREAGPKRKDRSKETQEQPQGPETKKSIPSSHGADQGKEQAQRGKKKLIGAIAALLVVGSFVLFWSKIEKNKEEDSSASTENTDVGNSVSVSEGGANPAPVPQEVQFRVSSAIRKKRIRQ